MKKIVKTTAAPAALGPYSQAVKVGNTLYVSGQIALNPETGKVIEGDIRVKLKRVMDNIRAIIEAADMKMENIVKVSIFLRSMDDFSAVNEEYAKYFKSDFPARETLQVAKLPLNEDIEISCIACES